MKISFDSYNKNITISLQERNSYIESEILKQADAKVCLAYAKNIINGRWLEAEEVISKDSSCSVVYCTEILRSRWPEAEIEIAKSREAISYYREIVKSRWAEGEPYFLSNLTNIKDYLSFLKDKKINITNENIKEIENNVISSLDRVIKDPASNSRYETPEETAFRYVEEIKESRWPEAERLIMLNAKNACKYAEKYIGGRWKEAEDNIINYQHNHYDNFFPVITYAKRVIKGRWLEAEPKIMMKTPRIAYHYAKEVINGRWPEAEEFICLDPFYAYEYAKSIINGRWPEAELFIAKDLSLAYEYAKNIIGARLPEEMHNMVIMQGMSQPDNEYLKKYLGYKKYKKEIKRRKPLLSS
jgi:hypothetical protein